MDDTLSWFWVSERFFLAGIFRSLSCCCLGPARQRGFKSHADGWRIPKRVTHNGKRLISLSHLVTPVNGLACCFRKHSKRSSSSAGFHEAFQALREAGAGVAGVHCIQSVCWEVFWGRTVVSLNWLFSLSQDKDIKLWVMCIVAVE